LFQIQTTAWSHQRCLTTASLKPGSDFSIHWETQ
jgi:hypothetical protein